MHEQQRLAGALIDVMQPMRTKLDEPRFEWIEILPRHFRFSILD